MAVADEKAAHDLTKEELKKALQELRKAEADRAEKVSRKETLTPTHTSNTHEVSHGRNAKLPRERKKIVLGEGGRRAGG